MRGGRGQSGAEEKRRARVVASEDALRELGYRYLARFSVTRARCARYLSEKVRDAVDAGAVRPEESARWVEAVIARLTEVGALDDGRYAEAKAVTLHQRGRATRVIARQLALKGVGADDAAQALEALAEDVAGDLDVVAAVTLARKRRLGPFGDPARREERRARDLGALARAGFPYALARRVVDAPDADALLAECAEGR
jgi:regulatory protein